MFVKTPTSVKRCILALFFVIGLGRFRLYPQSQFPV